MLETVFPVRSVPSLYIQQELEKPVSLRVISLDNELVAEQPSPSEDVRTEATIT